MIYLKNRTMIIPVDEQTIGAVGDGNAETRTFVIDRGMGNTSDMSILEFKLDLRYPTTDADNTALLTKTVTDTEILLTWTIIENDLPYSGIMIAQIRAYDVSGEIRWSSNQGYFNVDESIGDEQAYAGQLSAITLMEQRVSKVVASENARVAAEAQREIDFALAVARANQAAAECEGIVDGTGYIPLEQKGKVWGVASLDGNGKIPATELYVGTAGGLATLDGNRKVPTGLLPDEALYSHPTSDGNKHVPANGTTNAGKYLKATSTSGSYVWSNIYTVETVTLLGQVSALTEDALTGVTDTQGYYTNTDGTGYMIPVATATAASIPICDIDLSSVATADKATKIEAFCDALYYAVAGDGYVMFQVLGDVPTTDLAIKIVLLH